MPKVSVVIPTYNRGDLLRGCIESVLAQSFEDFGVIVVDDGSVDNTKEVVDSFGDPRVSYVYQDNRGLAAARNRGVELTRGDSVAFLDSDDALLPSALQEGVNVLAEHPAVAFSYGQAYHVDENGRIFGLEKPHPKYSCVRDGWEEIKDFLVFGNHVIESTLMVRRSCFEAVGGFASTFRSGSSGLDFWIRLAKRYSVAYIHKPLANFRIDSGSFSGRRSLGEWEATNGRIIESIFNDVEAGPVFAHLKPFAYRRLYTSLGGRACYHGDMKSARQYLRKALKVRSKGLPTKYVLFWGLLLAKTWIPQPALSLLRAAKRRLQSAALP